MLGERQRKLWKYIQESGFQPGLSEREQSRIRYCNQNNTLIALFILLCFPAPFWWLGLHVLAIVTVFSALHFACIFLISRCSRSVIFGRVYSLFQYNFVTLLYALALGRDSGIHYVFIACASSPFMLLDSTRRKTFTICALLPVFLFFLIEAVGDNGLEILTLGFQAHRLVYLATMPFVFATLFIFSGYFYLTNQKSGQKLRQTIEDLQRSQALIEEQQTLLVASSRLSAVGELAGGIAHEINNPLGIVKGYSEQLLKLLQKEDSDRDRMILAAQKISQTSDRISRIILSLRRLSYEGQGEPFERMDLAHIIEDTLAICRQSISQQGIDLRFSKPDGIYPGLCRPLQISQVLLNLIQNARDAVENLEEKWIRIDIQPRDFQFEVTVVDSGRGLPSEVASKIGQPFFTTKPFGKGTGLGISISRKIMSVHGGAIEVDQTRANTCFVMTLPHADSSPVLQS